MCHDAHLEQADGDDLGARHNRFLAGRVHISLRPEKVHASVAAGTAKVNTRSREFSDTGTERSGRTQAPYLRHSRMMDRRASRSSLWYTT